MKPIQSSMRTLASEMPFTTSAFASKIKPRNGSLGDIFTQANAKQTVQDIKAKYRAKADALRMRYAAAAFTTCTIGMVLFVAGLLLSNPYVFGAGVALLILGLLMLGSWNLCLYAKERALERAMAQELLTPPPATA
jgi:hypothetical protein